MKKIIYLLLLLPLMIIFISCTKSIKDYELNFHGFYTTQNQAFIIEDRHQLLELGDEELINNFDDDYFTTKQLIVIFHLFGNGLGENNFKVNQLSVKNKTIYLDLGVSSRGFQPVVVSYIVYIQINCVNAQSLVLTKTAY
ncbi:MAG: hypothetical protein LBV55_02010 [Acholeplasmatales bacterium]|jgi:hypothetical protein|nr:hypothetical protein [Acholeplasmatales bacterium]